MVRPKMLGEVQSLTNSAQHKEYFSSKYSLRVKAGGVSGLEVGQDIYCIPLVQNGVYELPVHGVKTKAHERGFKSKYITYILCKGINQETGEKNPDSPCCKLAQSEWDKFVENGKVGETLISFSTSRFYIPVLLLGNDAGTKAAKGVPVSRLTMSGRDYSYLEFSKNAFTSLIDQFKNDLLNNGRLEFGLEGAELYNALMQQLCKHVMKISITKPGSVGRYSKSYSFISFDNKYIGSETNSYRNITEGLTSSKKLQTEAAEFVTLFENELDSVLMPYTEAELEEYILGTSGVKAEQEAVYAQYGTAPKQATVATPKEEQIVIEEEAPANLDDIDEDDDLFDGQEEENIDDITLDDEPTTTTGNAPVVEDSFSLDDEDMSFDMGEEDFFGDE